MARWLHELNPLHHARRLPRRGQDHGDGPPGSLLHGRGQRVGLVTNDQAQDLVDTHALREQGFPVEEVAGACFCCKFDDLLDKVGRLESHQRPDVILAEPVGSCTDLVATVVQPLKDLYGTRFSVAPYGVLFKPSHGLKILRREAAGGFSPKAEYIFRKQLEEADAVLLNRIDELAPAQVEELAGLVAAAYPGVPVLRVSAKTGEGFEALTQLLDQEGNFGKKILDIDYDVYAAGEAELGWLNSSVRVRAGQPFALDDFLLAVVRGLQEALRDRGGGGASEGDRPVGRLLRRGEPGQQPGPGGAIAAVALPGAGGGRDRQRAGRD